jgi:hypothetical protein
MESKIQCDLGPIRLKHTEADHCVYTRTIDGKTSYITVWVDDSLLLTGDTVEMEEMKQSLRQKFTITNFGEPKLLIGLEIIGHWDMFWAC